MNNTDKKSKNLFGAHLETIAMHQLKENWPWFLGLGIGLSVLGILAIMFAWTSTLLSIIYLGSFLVIVGIFEAVKAFKINKWGYVLLHLALAILYIGCGLFIAFNPVSQAFSLTLILAIFFVITGLLKIFFALTRTMAHKGWVILSGVLNVILGMLILSQWPTSGIWVIGTFVGIDALFVGCSWIALALKAKKLAQ